MITHDPSELEASARDCENAGLVGAAWLLRSLADQSQSDEAAQRFRAALAPGYIVWHDGKRLSPEDTLTQIKRGLLAAVGG